VRGIGVGVSSINRQGTKTMASKVVSLQSNSPRHLSSVFGDYQGEICDLLLAINLVRLALEAEEDNRAQSGTARIALQHLEDMATGLKAKWHEDYASLRELS
jgi:hypothetical protein